MNDYPFGEEEKSFIEPELPYLLEKFNLIIVSTSLSDKITVQLDENIKIFHFQIDFTVYEKFKYTLKYFLNWNCICELVEILITKKKIIKRIRDSIGFYSCAEKLFILLKKNNIINKKKVNNIYSYWSHTNCMSIILHKNKYPKMKIISRLHGYDLYQERNFYGRQPFKSLLHQRIDQLIFVAEEARDYYLNTWNKLDQSICKLYKLGVINDYAVKLLNKKMKVMHIVSCSHIIELKRVDLIISALSEISSIEINWIHFGDGEDSEKIRFLADSLLSNKPNISYEFKGYVTNNEIKKYYAQNVIDCFISTSQSEGGCPVSIQEALSFGIPIIATRVGGIPSMINGNGILLPAKPTSEIIAKAIMHLRKESDDKIFEMRIKSRNIWENQYNAKINSKIFVDYIDKIFKD